MFSFISYKKNLFIHTVTPEHSFLTDKSVHSHSHPRAFISYRQICPFTQSPQSIHFLQTNMFIHTVTPEHSFLTDKSVHLHSHPRAFISYRQICPFQQSGQSIHFLHTCTLITFNSIIPPFEAFEIESI